MELDVNTFRAVWPVATLLINLVFVIAVFALRKTFATKQELSSHKAEHYQLKGEHEKLATQVKALPAPSDIEKLNISMGEVRGELKALGATLKKTDHMLTLLLENELKEKC